jgi:phosphoribosylamine-glycine ligase
MMIGKGPVMDGDKVVEAPIYQTSGEYVMVATGLGKTVTKAREKVYGAVKEVKFSNMICRNDIGEGLLDCLPKLHKLGYAKDMQP